MRPYRTWPPHSSETLIEKLGRSVNHHRGKGRTSTDLAVQLGGSTIPGGILSYSWGNFVAERFGQAKWKNDITNLEVMQGISGPPNWTKSRTFTLRFVLDL